ncbi:MAG: hypothetical protein ABL308_07160 [Oceanicaulis sp.]
MIEPIWLFLHILVFVYWLGGDLGAFYASRLVADPARPPAARGAAAHILMNVDMAPRMALIFTLPTGLALAASRGWIALDPLWVAVAFIAAVIWAGAAWLVHLKTGPHALARHFDTALRWVVMAGLLAAALAALAGVWDAPLFLSLKLCLLALTIGSGLMIRSALAGFGPAFAQVMAGEASADATVAASLRRAKRWVLVIWAALFAAALLGVYTPA